MKLSSAIAITPAIVQGLNSPQTVRNRPVMTNPMRHLLRHFHVAAVLGVLGLGGCAGKPNVLISDPMLSVDNSRVMMTVCHRNEPCTVGFLGVSTGELTKLSNDTDYHWTEATYSWDGSKIVVAVFPEEEISGIQTTKQLATMNADGSDFRIITSSAPHKFNPSFSPDGTKILFAQLVSAWPNPELVKDKYTIDLFTYDLETQESQRVTNLHWLQIQKPQFLPDGEQILIGGERYLPSGRIYTTSWGDAMFLERIVKEHRIRYEENKIYVFPNSFDTQLAEPFIVRGEHSSQASVAADGSVLFLSRTNKDDGIGGKYTYDLFLKREANTFRLTHMGSYLTFPRISVDGKHAVFMSDAEPRDARIGDTKLWIIETDGTELRELVLPRFPDD